MENPFRSSSSFSLYRFYLALVSFVSLIASVIALGATIQQSVMRIITTDEEYVMKNRWEVQNCENPQYAPDKAGVSVEVRKSAADIAKCKEEKRGDILQTRNIDFKEGVATGVAWGLLFMIVFVFHFPRFSREYHGK